MIESAAGIVAGRGRTTGKWGRVVVRVLDGRYELVRFVGRGGMGEVWEGRDRRIGRRVAVKLLPHGRGDTSGTALFLREAQTAGALDHPGVVTVFDVGQDAADDSLFMVMEFVQGRDLSALLREDGVPPVTDAVDWTAQAAAALGRAHTAGIVHRDLKPANLMLTAEGRVKVLDFGIARFMESTNHSSKVMGTLAYMPPERFDEHPGDARSDLYSLGCVLHELLTGKVPFEATGPVGMMNAHLLKTPARPGEHRPGIPPALDRLVLELLAKDPDERPATAEQVRERLHAVTAPAPASAGPGDGRPRENAGAAAATEPNLAAPPRTRDGAAVGTTPDRDPVHAAPTVGPNRAGVSDDEERTGAGGATTPAVAPGRRRFLWLAAGAAVTAGGITAAVALNDRGSPGASGDVPTDRATSGPSLTWRFATGDDVTSSPTVVDGVVYVGSFDKNVYALDAATGAKKWSYPTGGGVNSAPAVVGGVVYIGSGDKNVYALDAATGAKKWSYPTGDEVTSSPVVVNGVVYIGGVDRNVYALDAATGTKKWSYTTGRVYSSPAVVDGVVYVGSNESRVYALDAVNGVEKWSYRGGRGFNTSPEVVGGVVYIGSEDSSVYALDAVTGGQKWSYTTGREVSSSPAVVGGVVYIGSEDYSVYALDAATGAKKWSYPTGDKVLLSSPAVVGGVVYVGSDDKNVYALDAATGAKKWSYPTGDKVQSSPAVVDGVVYVGSDDKNVYALDVATRPVRSSP
ncbi:PQQ-binding-like beta-propeller repeat protein [Embleya sp. NBC_00896]|uniref:outer membrane protein assembly factor BamB family protein n=1 Tax=Embleya sp. NBC_00896 TaxID=2975961 RepID=UPI002F918DC1